MKVRLPSKNRDKHLAVHQSDEMKALQKKIREIFGRGGKITVTMGKVSRQDNFDDKLVNPNLCNRSFIDVE